MATEATISAVNGFVEQALIAGQEITGAFELCLRYPVMFVSVDATVDSAADGIEIEWSRDGVNACQKEFATFTFDAARLGNTFIFCVRDQYVRVNYTNGGTGGDVGVLVWFLPNPTKVFTESLDGAHESLGATTDAEAAGDGSVIALLKRLRTLLGGIDTGTDGIEALLTTIDASLTAIDGNTDGVEGQLTTITGHIDTLEALLATVIGHIDGVETALGTLALESGGNLAAILTALQIIDDWDETDRAKVNPIAGQVGVAAGAGTTDALTQRVVIASDQAPVPVESAPSQGTLTDQSGTITLGGTSQEVMPANASRKYLLFQNVSDTIMWIDFTAAAVENQPSIRILPEASFVMEAGFISTEVLNVICAATGKAFVAKEA